MTKALSEDVGILLLLWNHARLLLFFCSDLELALVGAVASAHIRRAQRRQRRQMWRRRRKRETLVAAETGIENWLAARCTPIAVPLVDDVVETSEMARQNGK